MTFTHLTLGTPKFRRKIEYEPLPYVGGGCVETLVTGEVLSELGTWEDDSIIATEDGDWGWASGSTPALAYGWGVVGGATGANLVSVALSTANPRNGSQHMRVVYGSDDTAHIFTCGGGVNCLATTFAPVVARVEEGSSVTASAWLDRTVSVAGGGVNISMTLLNSSYIPISGGTASDSITGSTTGYEELTANIASAPANSYWVRLTLSFSGASTNDVDDVTLTIG